MRKQIITVALVGGLGLGGAALAVPGIASAADSATTAASGVADRVAKLKQALAGLVTNGTITQSQADKVATTLAAQLPDRGPGHGPGRGGPGGPGGPGHLSPEAVATVLGVTVEELRAGHEAGKTLAQIAADEGMSKSTLISKLVAAAKAQLAADVKAGKLTQAQADSLSSTLTARITERVDSVGPPKGPHGPRPDGAPSTSSSTTASPNA
ncbi:MAG: hypothetical protein JJD92_07885 [Frankiaceae bacterium]|nr:hypothetical protein [Frankiaceae bacterium]